MLGNEMLLDDMIGTRFALISTDVQDGKNLYRFVAELGGVFLKVGMDFRDVNRQFTNWCEKHKIHSVLIRPDRYIYDVGVDGAGDRMCGALLKQLESYADTRPEQNRSANIKNINTLYV